MFECVIVSRKVKMSTMIRSSYKDIEEDSDMTTQIASSLRKRVICLPASDNKDVLIDGFVNNLMAFCGPHTRMKDKCPSFFIYQSSSRLKDEENIITEKLSEYDILSVVLVLTTVAGSLNIDSLDLPQDVRHKILTQQVIHVKYGEIDNTENKAVFRDISRLTFDDPVESQIELKRTWHWIYCIWRSCKLILRWPLETVVMLVRKTWHPIYAGVVWTYYCVARPCILIPLRWTLKTVFTLWTKTWNLIWASIRCIDG